MLVAKAISEPTYYNRKRAKAALAKEEVKKQVKEDFEKYLNEEMNKYPLSYNPYQE